MTSVNWENLRHFAAVARLGSLSAAGRELQADHATVARRLLALENAREVALFHRGPKGYALTPAGERLLSYVRRMEDAARDAEQMLAFQRSPSPRREPRSDSWRNTITGDMTVAVFSASARPGQAQVRQLRGAGYNVRAISRSRLPAFQGLEVAPADLNDPESVRRACEGADAVFFTSPTFTEHNKGVEHAATVGRLAKEAGVKRLVFNPTSWHPDGAVRPMATRLR